MVNLLTEEMRRERTKRYIRAVGDVWLTVLATSIALLGLVLIPVYIMARSAEEEGAQYLAAAVQIAERREQLGALQEMAELTERVRVVSETQRSRPYMSRIVQTVSQSASPISISEISLTAIAESAAAVTIRGTAASRAALVSYTNDLKDVPEISALSLPVSAYAGDRNAPFTISFRWSEPAP
ncbi:hypothetical protein KGO06_02390 [Patescibacteria group bacterium]|nr:hypothetical protein [Patescibacteria group bacterium]